MKTPEPSGVEGVSGTHAYNPDRKKIQIPEGSLLYDIEKAKQAEPVIGLTEMTETTLGDWDFLNFFPRKDREKLKERMPATVAILDGLRDQKRLIWGKRGIRAEEVNKVIDLATQLYLLDEYITFSKDVLKSLEGLTSEILFPLENYNRTKTSNPGAFTSATANVATVHSSVQNQLSQFGLIVDQLKKAIPETEAKINSIIKELDNMDLLVIENVAGNDRRMWWPIKRFVDKPYSSLERDNS